MNPLDEIFAPGTLADDEGHRGFSEPWEVQAFALVQVLIGKDVFSAQEWAEAFGAELKQDDAAEDASDYYVRMVATLEALLNRKSVADRAAVDVLTEAWHRAARATPHGMPIELENDPERPQSSR